MYHLLDDIEKATRFKNLIKKFHLNFILKTGKRGNEIKLFNVKNYPEYNHLIKYVLGNKQKVCNELNLCITIGRDRLLAKYIQKKLIEDNLNEFEELKELLHYFYFDKEYGVKSLVKDLDLKYFTHTNCYSLFKLCNMEYRKNIEGNNTDRIKNVRSKNNKDLNHRYKYLYSFINKNKEEDKINLYSSRGYSGLFYYKNKVYLLRSIYEMWFALWLSLQNKNFKYEEDEINGFNIDFTVENKYYEIKTDFRNFNIEKLKIKNLNIVSEKGINLIKEKIGKYFDLNLIEKHWIDEMNLKVDGGKILYESLKSKNFK